MPSSLISPRMLPPSPGRTRPFGARLLLAAITASVAMPAGAVSGGSSIPFEGALRRAVAIEGEIERRFDLTERMAHYRVPGVSIAVIENCHIVDARGFGLRAWGREPVSAETIFQAGSISKSVTAIGALRLVERGTIALDRDVRLQMKGWTYKDTLEPVTLRRLLAHTAGTNVAGMKGYLPGSPLPSTAQILRGEKPSNIPAINVESEPGSRWRYSGGGYVVAQSLMSEATGKDFAPLMQNLVLKPLAMTRSSYEQPLPQRRRAAAAEGTSADGSALPGKWRIYPEMAAAGLWTTPSDLARFAIGLARSARGDESAILNKDATDQLMTRGLGHWGLGVDLGPDDGVRQISHTGKTIGFTSMFIIYPDRCQGAVVMTNGYDGGWLINEIMSAIGDVYRWPGRKEPAVEATIPLTEAITRRFAGNYRLKDFPAERFSISRDAHGDLRWAREGHVGRTLLPATPAKLFSPDSVMTIESPDPGRAATVTLSFDGGSNIAERID